MSYKIGWKHVHARDTEGYTGCHADPCQCNRCLLENGTAIPKERRAEVERFREHISEMYKCEKCGGIKVSLLPGDEKRKIPSTLWCMTCGNNQMASKDTSTRLSSRLAQDTVTGQQKPKAGPSLRERLTGSASNSQVVGNGTRSGAVSSAERETKMEISRRDWTPEERRDLKALIDARGVTAGSRAYVDKYPERGRTNQGCAYQWNTNISKGKGI